ncbi:MAG: twin-arginine translocation pathway signal, partial [Flavobacteriales bacterium]
MNRRKFLRNSSLVTLGGLSVRGFSSPLMQALRSRALEDRVLVVVQMIGGNDGLNTVIPLDQYDVLSQFRTNVLIPETQVLPLTGLSGTGLHPSMGGMRDLWEDGKLGIIQGVSYPDPNYSHFRSTDIWETGANSDQQLNSGWTG